MRIITRPDFDGVVCAALLYEALDIKKPVKWTQPTDIQNNSVKILKGDIIANLPYHKNCSYWFDHHYSNQIRQPFDGMFKIAPSAAGIIFEYYEDRFKQDFRELIRQTDKIDSADLSHDEIIYPENYPFILLSMTISGYIQSDEAYWNRLTDMLRTQNINEILDDPEIRSRCQKVVLENKEYEKHLLKHTRVKNKVAITDFCELNPVPDGNRFLVYALFPDAVVHIKTFNNEGKMVVKVGHSIINPNCNVNVGKMLNSFEGGGHKGAGACRFDPAKSKEYIPKILEILFQNKA